MEWLDMFLLTYFDYYLLILACTAENTPRHELILTCINVLKILTKWWGLTLTPDVPCVTKCPLPVSGLRPDCLGPASLPSLPDFTVPFSSPLIMSALSNNQKHAGATTASTENIHILCRLHVECLISITDGKWKRYILNKTEDGFLFSWKYILCRVDNNLLLSWCKWCASCYFEWWRYSPEHGRIIKMKDEITPRARYLFSKLKENSCLLGLSVSGMSPAVSNSKGCGKHKFQGLVFVQVG